MNATAGNAGPDGTVRVCSDRAAQLCSMMAMAGVMAGSCWRSGMAVAGRFVVLKTGDGEIPSEGSNPSPSAPHSPPAANCLQDDRRVELGRRMAQRRLRMAESAWIGRPCSVVPHRWPAVATTAVLVMVARHLSQSRQVSSASTPPLVLWLVTQAWFGWRGSFRRSLRYRWSHMRGVDEFMHGFDAGEQQLLSPPVRIEADTRVRLVQVLAAIVLGSTPEEIAGYLDAGFPSEVEAMLARPLEAEEMSGHLDQLLAAMQTTATVVA